MLILNKVLILSIFILSFKNKHFQAQFQIPNQDLHFFLNDLEFINLPSNGILAKKREEALKYIHFSKLTAKLNLFYNLISQLIISIHQDKQEQKKSHRISSR